jgi:hypothetical protein
MQVVCFLLQEVVVASEPLHRFLAIFKLPSYLNMRHQLICDVGVMLTKLLDRRFRILELLSQFGSSRRVTATAYSYT